MKPGTREKQTSKQLLENKIRVCLRASPTPARALSMTAQRTFRIGCSPLNAVCLLFYPFQKRMFIFIILSLFTVVFYTALGAADHMSISFLNF
jgi:hypothetical protein